MGGCARCRVGGEEAVRKHVQTRGEECDCRKAGEPRAGLYQLLGSQSSDDCGLPGGFSESTGPPCTVTKKWTVKAGPVSALVTRL